MNEHGTMDLDFRERCAVLVRESPYAPEHQIIFYGMTTKDMSKAWSEVIDMPTPYAALGKGGKRPDEKGITRGEQKYHFNHRIEALPSHHHSNRAAVQVESHGKISAGQADGARRRAGTGGGHDGGQVGQEGEDLI
jgi:hypothetical protein